MTVTREWYEALDAVTILLVDELVASDSPSDAQLEEAVEMVSTWRVDALGFDPDARERLEAAVADLEAKLEAADPRPRFLRMHDGVELSERLVAFYSSGEHSRYQHRALLGTNYAPYAMHVDFDAIYWLLNPDFTAESIGAQYVVFANLIADLENDPEGSECYAHLAIDPQTTRVYLMEPSGQPELIAEDLDAFLDRLGAAPEG